MRASALLVAERLRASAVVGKAVKEGKVKLLAARYDLDSGLVQLLR